jgi:hypothetical protein
MNLKPPVDKLGVQTSSAVTSRLTSDIDRRRERKKESELEK